MSYTFSGTGTLTNAIVVSVIPSPATSCSVTIIGYNTIDDRAFLEYSGINSLLINNSVITIGSQAFQDCSGLTSVIIPNSVTSLGTYVFEACTHLTNITLSNQLTAIPDVGFRSCFNLTSIIIPPLVTYIGNYAFSTCSNLNSVYIPNSVIDVDITAFNNYPSTLTAYVSPSFTDAQKATLLASGITNIVVIEPACFLEGAKILCFKNDEEIYIPIDILYKERDKILVKTLLHGYKKIDTIVKFKMYNSDLTHYKERLYKCTSTNYPEIFEDLFITGCHSILVDYLKDEEYEKIIELLKKIYITDNKYRLLSCVDTRAELVQDIGVFTIYHIALENNNIYTNYGIFANGLLVESCSKNTLMKIDN